MLDLDFHPDEPTVRCFTVPDAGILVQDESRCTYQVRNGEIVLRHFAFADEWFKLNVTHDPAGTLVETGEELRFAVNCDIATPMVRTGADISAVDLFLDVLVSADLHTHTVIDRDEFEEACSSGLLSPAEAIGAEAGLARLLGWIDSGRLAEVVSGIPPRLAATAPAELPVRRVPVSDVPSVQPGTRVTW